MDKQIKELSNDLYASANCNLTNESDYVYVARDLHKAGYRKISDNQIVIGKEEYENLKKEVKEMEEQRDRQAYITEDLIQEKHLWTEQAIKETARAYHDKMQKIIHERDYVEGYAEIGLQEENDEIAKQFGVEIGEE